MKIAICDDNTYDTDIIRKLLDEHFKKSGYVGEFHTFTNGEELVENFICNKFDAVFLDIYMDGIDGIKTAEKLRKIDPGFALVFITSSHAHAMQSYSVCANSYVSKPINKKDIENAFAQCQRTFIKNGKFIEVLSGRAKIKIPLIKILFMEVYGKEVIIHTTDEKISTMKSLDELEKMVDASFLRCHRSYIINLNHVSEILLNDFKMRNGSLVPIRQRRRAEVRDTYADFVSDKLFEVAL